MRATLVTLSTAALSLALGCGGGSSSTPTTSGERMAARDMAPLETSNPPEGRANGGEMHDMAGMTGMCPMEVSGTTIQAEDTDGGVALVFRTSGDVNELVRRVQHMAEMHNGSEIADTTAPAPAPGEAPEPGAPAGGANAVNGQNGTMDQRMNGGASAPADRASEMATGGAGGSPSTGPMHHTFLYLLPPSQAQVVSIDGGARLELTPREAGQLAMLRQQARRHADMLSSGRCPMRETGSAPSARR